MPCYHPLKGFIIGTNPRTGNNMLKVAPYVTDHVEKRADGKFVNVPDSSVTPFSTVYDNFVDIPCGNCIGCRLSHAKSWADRAVLELGYHNHNAFITLTYDDDHVPENPVVDKDTGEIEFYSLTLKKEDLQKFWKRLRKDIDSKGGEKIRYLACGEYGSKTLRPHYHAIVFGLFVPDLVFYGYSDSGERIYESKWLDSIWKNGKVWIGEATWESIAYVSRYITKKFKGAWKDYYEVYNIQPEFLVCSRKPGIARQYYEDNKDKLFTESRYFFPTAKGAGSAVPGRYFNHLFQDDFDPLDVEYRKNALKQQFEDRKKLELSNTTKTYLDYLLDKEYNKKKQIESLKRDSN